MNEYRTDEILDLVEQSCGLIADAIFIWRFHALPHEVSYGPWEKQCAAYWRYFPNLAEMEEAERQERIKKARLPWEAAFTDKPRP